MSAASTQPVIPPPGGAQNTTKSGGGLPLSHFLIALGIVAVWGTNFTVIRMGLNHLPPVLFAALRFAFAFFPACLFIKRPAVPWLHLIAYGVLIGAGQFGVMFIAMNHDISPGLASLVVQIQVFFTIGMAMIVTRERMRPFQLVALALSAAGLILIAARAGGAATPLGIGLVIFAALSWAGGNTVARQSPGADMLGYVVWASLFSALSAGLMALVFEGAGPIRDALAAAPPSAWAAVLWQSFGNVLFGYVAWAWLLNRHPAAVIAPMSLLVPVFGIGASAIFLGEPVQPWKIAATLLVLGGLAFNLLWPRLRARFS